MENGKKKDIKDSGKDLVIETILDVGSGIVTDIAKESMTSIFGEILVDTAGSLIPGVSGAISGYKRARFERNIKRLTDELQTRMNEIQLNLESKSQDQKNRIDELFKYVLDFVIMSSRKKKYNLW